MDSFKKVIVGLISLVLFFCFALASKVLAATPVTVTLQPTAEQSKETYIAPYCDDKNQGGNFLFLFDGAGSGLPAYNWQARDLISFDLSSLPPGSVINSAELFLHTGDVYDGSQVIKVVAHRLTENWVEGNGAMWCIGTADTLDGATWQLASAGNSWTTPGGDYDITPEGFAYVGAGYSWYSWNITSLTQKWLNGIYPNYGLILIPEEGFSFYKILESADYLWNPNSVNRPKLVVTYTQDETPPTTTLSLSGTVGNNDWYTSDVDVTLTASDEDGTGVAKTEYSFDDTTWFSYSPFTLETEGTTTLYYRSTDYAGNMETTKTQLVKIDKTPPSIVINIPIDGQEYLLGENVLADWSAADAVSGLASQTGTVPDGGAIDTSSTGEKTFTVTAEDYAGNQNTQTITYFVRYSYGGLLEPIKDGKEFKLGSAIMVKFQLQDAIGNYISTATAHLFVDDQPATAKGNSNEGNLFRYDEAMNQYVFNLDTESLPTGSHELAIKLDDGASYETIIQIK